MSSFFNPHTRTFRPLCRQAVLAMAAGPIVAALIVVIMAALP